MPLSCSAASPLPWLVLGPRTDFEAVPCFHRALRQESGAIIRVVQDDPELEVRVLPLPGRWSSEAFETHEQIGD